MKRLLAVIGCVLLLSGVAFGATYYIDQTGGLDANTGLATDNAWKTISKVNGSSFSAGDSILFKKGETWDETLTVPSSGTNGNPISFGAYGSGAAPLLSQADTRNYGILTNGKSYLNFSNMNVTGAVVDGILKAASDPISNNLIFDNVATSGNGQYGYRLYGVANSSIKNSSIGSQTRYDGIYIGPITDHTASTNVDIDNNSFLGTYGRWCLSFTGCRNCTVTNSTFSPVDTGTGESTSGIIDIEPNALDNTSNISITGNYVTVPVLSANGFAIQATATLANDYADNVVISNNVLDMGDTATTIGIKIAGINGGESNRNIITQCGGSASYAMMIRGDSTGITASRNKVSGVGLQCYAFSTNDSAVGAYYYNIADNVLVPFNTASTSTGTFYNNTANEFYYRGFNATNSSNIIGKNNVLRTTDTGNQLVNDNTTGTKEYDYNVYYTADASNIFTTGVTNYNNLAAWVAATGQDAHSVQADPLFVSSSDFHLQSASPAINAGVDVGLVTDYAGRAVPNGAGVDIGAYEWYGKMSLPTSPSFPSFPDH